MIKEIEDLQVRLFTDTENETVRVASINISKDVLYNRFNANIDSLVEKAKIVAQKEGIYLGLLMEVIPKGFPKVRPENKIMPICSIKKFIFLN